MTPLKVKPKPKIVTNSSTEIQLGATEGRSREELNRLLMDLYRPYLRTYPKTEFAEVLKERYQVAETRQMNTEQLEDLIFFMEGRMKAVA